ncbi:hypothetical protein ACOME3_002509 [Neoechinorhynchus agilis]
MPKRKRDPKAGQLAGAFEIVSSDGKRERVKPDKPAEDVNVTVEQKPSRPRKLRRKSKAIVDAKAYTPIADYDPMEEKRLKKIGIRGILSLLKTVRKSRAEKGKEKKRDGFFEFLETADKNADLPDWLAEECD